MFCTSATGDGQQSRPHEADPEHSNVVQNRMKYSDRWYMSIGHTSHCRACVDVICAGGQCVCGSAQGSPATSRFEGTTSSSASSKPSAPSGTPSGCTCRSGNGTGISRCTRGIGYWAKGKEFSSLKHCFGFDEESNWGGRTSAAPFVWFWRRCQVAMFEIGRIYPNGHASPSALTRDSVPYILFSPEETTQTP